MILVISCFITHKRPVNRYDRLDIFKHTLKSYSKINWKNVYLFIKLDWEFRSRRGELKEFINTVFHGVSVQIEWTRYEKQGEWKSFIETVTKEDDLIWFTQNDDHPFIDEDLSVLNEGVNLLESDPAPFKSLYFSHWPEILRLSGKLSQPEKVGNYIRFHATMLDAIQIFSSKFIRYIFLDVNWGGKRYKRIDTLLRQRSIWGESNGNMDDGLQVIYVPLRELCRKFSAYGHVHMHNVPALEFSYEIQKPNRGRQDVISLITAEHSSMWTKDNDFSIPEEWIEQSVNLYK
jgi:hypothetical protein